MKGKIILITGSACVGKTTLGRELSKKLGCMYLDTETISQYFSRELVKEKGLDMNDRDSDVYMREIKPLEDKTYYAIMKENLDLGITVVTSKVFKKEDREGNGYRRILTDNGIQDADVKVIVLQVENEIELKNRIEKRNHPKDKWKLLNWDKYYQGVKDYNITWDKINKMVVDNSNFQCQKYLDQIIEFLQE